DRGITHRDVKPANILLEQCGSIKLSDYGIAQFFGGTRLTEVNSVVGTLEYMSPEQTLAQPVGPRTDMYALGAVLYTLISGNPPFVANNLAEMMRRHREEFVPTLRSKRSDIPEELESIIAHLLQIRPENRPQNTYLVAKRFQSLLQALHGPPESVIIRPIMPGDGTSRSIEPEKLPKKKEASATKFIWNSPHLINDEGIIELGGEHADDFSTSEQISELHKSTPLAETRISSPKSISEMQVMSETHETEFAIHDIPSRTRKTLESDGSGGSFLDSFCTPAESISVQRTADSDFQKSNLDTSDVTTQSISVTNKANNASNANNTSHAAGVPKSSTDPPNQYRNKNESDSDSPEPARTTSKFVSIKGKNFDDFGTHSERNTPIFSFQMACVSLAIFVTGMAVLYLLQPISADQLYERIMRTVNEISFEDKSDRIAFTALRRAEHDIELFWAEFPSHPKFDEIQHYKDELELAALERKLERRQQMADSSLLTPIERIYIDVLSLEKTNPDETIIKLQAILDLFPDDIESDTSSSARRRAASPAKLCLELVARHLSKLKSEQQLRCQNQIDWISSRLTFADNVEDEQPEYSQQIRAAIIELYNHHSWASELVQEAKNKLNPTKTKSDNEKN
ncbi:MAG: serine/threonine protein kinase, partial [Thermoguttaceae bacterium]